MGASSSILHDPSPIESIPHEILVEIFRYLYDEGMPVPKRREILSPLRSVCWKWNDIVANALNFKPVINLHLICGDATVKCEKQCRSSWFSTEEWYKVVAPDQLLSTELSSNVHIDVKITCAKRTSASSTAPMLTKQNLRQLSKIFSSLDNIRLLNFWYFKLEEGLHEEFCNFLFNLRRPLTLKGFLFEVDHETHDDVILSYIAFLKFHRKLMRVNVRHRGREVQLFKSIVKAMETERYNKGYWITKITMFSDVETFVAARGTNSDD
ncbi:hypothetical protein QR680_002912 [Steinernema hermaphroditum]|uniref:F-box domain-containing protein n=1 Tax=Steinernema hermaphroditum TaxID=289476 RepID=A0AA39H4K1_9BILA|nr:hypothetical protein QR680_002912 [Steinernema hermaphroditum]